MHNGTHDSLTLSSPDCHTIAALFITFGLDNVGGSDSFTKKRKYFDTQLREHHGMEECQKRERITLNIDRDNVLNTVRLNATYCIYQLLRLNTVLYQVMKATKRFTTADWSKKFNIRFNGEDGEHWHSPYSTSNQSYIHAFSTGVDCGGPSREFIDLLSVELFDPAHGNTYFVQLDDDLQAPVCMQHTTVARASIHTGI